MANMFYHVVKNLFNKPATKHSPIGERQPFERTRGRIKFEEENCVYCGICQKKCPADAIVVNRGEKLWELNAFRCIICGECVGSCPKKCITMNNERRHSSRRKKFVSLKRQEM